MLTLCSIKEALDKLDKVKEQKSHVLEEAVQKCQNYNAVEQLVAVHRGQAEKGTVFEQCKSEFRQIFTQLEAHDKQAEEAKSAIQA